jgi:hypothetical protein
MAAHFADLFSHDRPFMLTTVKPQVIAASTLEAADSAAAHRVAIDSSLAIASNRQMDDVGFFDSLILARPYQIVMALVNAPPTLNTQVFDGSALSRSALAWLGVQFVMTDVDKTTGKRDPAGKINVYQVPDAAPRAIFVSARQARQASQEEVREALLAIGKAQTPQQLPLLLDRPPILTSAAGSDPSGVRYLRPDSDTILLQVSASEPGYVRLIESADPGWHAEVDDKPIEIATAYGALMAIPVPAGNHELKLTYSTPGTTAGGILSGICVVILIGLEWLGRRPKRTAPQEST